MAMKRPASGVVAGLGLGCPAAAPALELRTPLHKCVCGGALVKHKVVDALKYGFAPPEPVYHKSMRCNRKDCRLIHGHNFMWVGGDKQISVNLDDLSDNVLFVNNKVCFDIQFLQYHSVLQFRGFESYRCATYAQEVVFGVDHTASRFRKHLANALVLYVAMKELAALDLVLDLKLSGEDEMSVTLTHSMVEKYSAYLHDVIFPGSTPSDVREIAMDGHEKVLMRCEHAPKRGGRPRSVGQPLKFTNGWFMLVNPKDSRILGVTPQLNPENNATKLAILRRTIGHYPRVNCLIHDRICSFVGEAGKHKELSGVKYFCVDMWHGAKHSDACKCNPHVHLRLKRRLRGVNSSVSEQVFSWFRNYARILNDMRPVVHKFLVLVFCKLHNELIAKGDKDHLNLHRASAPAGGSYACARKRPASSMSA